MNLVRKTYTDKSTIGRLTFDDLEFFTLEDTARRGVKVYGKTAIPKGRYEVVISASQRFKRLMPLLLDVPGFEGVRIHSGNTAEDTEGCILVGTTYDPGTPDYIGQSQLAFQTFYPKLEEALKQQRVFISIT